MSATKSRLSAVMVGGAVLFGLAAGSAAGAAATKPAKRYCDPLYGFSLCPPAETQWSRGDSPSHLVTWSGLDPARGAVVWTLSIHQASEAKENIELEPYSRALAGTLWAEEGLKASSVGQTRVAGKDAIDIRGQTVAANYWQRQVWILAQPQEFIIVKITGPASMAKSLAATSDRVLATLELVDPTPARQLQQQNLARGEELLAGLNRKKFAAAVRTEPQWYLLRMADRYVGFRRVVEAPATRQDAQGYEVKIWLKLEIPKLGRRLMKHTMFVAADLSVEWSRKHLQIGDANAGMIITETLRQKDLIVCTVTKSGRTQPRKLRVPESCYLPQAAGMFLPRLICLKPPAARAFLVYSGERNTLELRTLTVVGPDEIALGGRKIKATRMVDQPARDASAATVWLDAKGNLLRMKAPDGLIMEQSSLPAVKRRFPEAEATLKVMGD